MARAATIRALGFLGLWLVIGGGGGPADWAVGALAAVLACRVSLRLAPPGPGIDAMAALRLAAALPGAALRAGWDVARRALSPGMALQPGLVPHRLGLPPGPGRDGFLALASLLPGTLPAGTPDAEGVVPIHALDTAQPIAAALARDEARYAALARGAARCAAIRRHG